MKIKQVLQLILAVAGVLMVDPARATLYSYDFNDIDTTVPDGSMVGYVNSQSISGIPNDGGANTPEILDVNVRLDLTGGYNGDLYGYLQLHDENGNSVLTVLLNRVGTGSGGEPQNSYGFSTAGMDVTLDDQSGNGNIHDVDVANPTSGESFQPDAGTGSLADFNGKSANGTWTLFLADESGGNTSTLVSWGLDIEVVPEPVTWAILVFMGLAGMIRVFRRKYQGWLKVG